ncbi:MAG TPA: glycosyltransferase [Anaerolineae bacterium]|nr:glycosyltransferase [Anaerolineae bacterium]
MTALKRDRIVLLHVIDTLGLGGAERFLVDLCLALPADRYQVIVSAVSGDGPRSGDLAQAGIELFSLQARSNWDVVALFRLARFMRRRRVDIVHTHLFVGGVFGRLAAAMAGVRARLTTEQNAYAPGRHPPRWQMLANAVLARSTGRVVAVSEGTQEYLQRQERVPGEKIRVLPNAISWPETSSAERVTSVLEELGAGDRTPILGTVARLTEQKGQRYLLQALADLRLRYPRLFCIFAGEGESRSELESLSRRLGLEEHVTFCGARRDVAIMLQGLDLFVLPSLFEGLPLALLEAMAAGIPVVATSVAGSSEVIEDGVNGRLVPPADVPALTEAIADVLGNDELGRAMAEKGQETVACRYSIGAVAEAYGCIYEELLQE